MLLFLKWFYREVGGEEVEACTSTVSALFGCCQEFILRLPVGSRLDGEGSCVVNSVHVTVQATN